jgi:hypothetical protein
MTNQNAPQETLAEAHARVSSAWSMTADKAQLSESLRQIQDVSDDVGNLQDRAKELRALGYVYNKDWEDTLKQIKRRWPAERREAEREHERLARDLARDARQLDQKLRQARRSRNLLENIERDIDYFEQQVNNANQRVLGMFSTTSDQLGDIYEEVEWAEFLLENLRSASFKLYPNENGVAAVKAEWISQKKEPEGILYLTDQRIIFETTEEKATKKILFIATEKEIVKEVAWEAPIGAVEKFDAEDKGGLLGFNVKELLTLQFSRKAKDVPKEVVLRFRDHADNEYWEELISMLKSGALDEQKLRKRTGGGGRRPTKQIVAPTICPSCGGKLPQAFKGMQALECEFCGNVVNLVAAASTDTSAEGGMLLEVYESAVDEQPQVVSTFATADEIKRVVDGLDWDDITFVTTREANGDLLECSGSHEDGFSARYMESGKEFFSDTPPASTNDMIALLTSYVAKDGRWRKMIAWG